MSSLPISRPWRWATRAASLAACLAFWQLAAGLQLNLGLVTFANVPTPGAVLLAACNLAQSSVLLAHLGASLARVFAGYLLAAALGIALGLAIGRSAWAEALLLPPLEVLRPIPAVAWIPLAILMFPSSEASMIFITFTGAAGPGIFTGLAIGMGTSWFCLVTAEMISGQWGLGYYTWASYNIQNYDEVVVGMLLIGLFGMGSSGLVKRVGVSLTPWYAAGGKVR
ncbi:ABC transporter permease [Pseudomonas aeruginosa]|uniref:ABC transporter permease n=1 Tax=Pseudomonas aeruginosa TaxID=287 RepID=UPI00104457C9|nr:ABC transporter permease [Pseudomonas aeruginosa]